MNILNILAIMGPGLISLKIEQQNKKEINNIESLMNYGIFVLINNLISMTIACSIFNIERFDDNFIFIIKYIFLSLLVSTISPFLLKYLSNNIKISIK